MDDSFVLMRVVVCNLDAQSFINTRLLAVLLMAVTAILVSYPREWSRLIMASPAKTDLKYD